MSNKTLNNGAFLFFAVIMTGLLFNLFANRGYKTPNVVVLQQTLNEDYLLNYGQLHQIFQDQKQNDWLFVDLRSADQYAAGHLPGAVHIPFAEILQGKQLKKIRKGQSRQVVLYSDDESGAQSARMLLSAMGIHNLRVLAGNYELARQHVLESFDPAWAFYKDDKARFDYRRFMQSAAPSSRPNAGSPIIPEVRTPIAAAAGGC